MEIRSLDHVEILESWSGAKYQYKIPREHVFHIPEDQIVESLNLVRLPRKNVNMKSDKSGGLLLLF